jgi:hypothetical protein
MSGGDRARIDPGLAVLRGVAACAPGIGGGVGFVHPVAVEAITRTRVMVLLFGVAARAGLRRKGRRLVRAVAVPTGLVGVGTDRGHVAALGLDLILGMTAQTIDRRDREIRAEAVAVLARRWLRVAARLDWRKRPEWPEWIDGVERRANVRVAPAADLRRRYGESVIAVAVATRNAAWLDVGAMARAGAHVAPHPRHVLWAWRPVAGTGAARPEPGGQGDHGHDGPPHRDPIG